jgi:hypothetical protein
MAVFFVEFQVEINHFFHGHGRVGESAFLITVTAVILVPASVLIGSEILICLHGHAAALTKLF